MLVPHPNARTKAFTLIELLVVIAILSLLVSLLMPSLRQAVELTRQVTCMTRVRQMGTAVQMYANDYDGCKPATRLDNSYAGLWFFSLGGGRSEPFQDGYLPNPFGAGVSDFWRCPSYYFEQSSSIHYGMSRSHGFHIPFRLDHTTTVQDYNTGDKSKGRAAANPSLVSIIGCGCISESRITRRYFPPSLTYPDPLNSGFYVWHDKGSPFVFLDGHAETRTHEFLVNAAGTGPSGNSEADHFWGHLHQ